MDIEFRGTKFLLDKMSGGRGLRVHNRRLDRPYCDLLYEGKVLIEDPVAMAIGLLNGLFPETLAVVGSPVVHKPPEEESAEDQPRSEDEKPGEVDPATLRVCPICEKVLGSEGERDAHVAEHKKEDPVVGAEPGNKLLVCAYCQKPCKTKAGLTSHMYHAHGRSKLGSACAIKKEPRKKPPKQKKGKK